MTRSLFAALILAMTSLASSGALAQDISAAQRAACKADYDKYCKGTFPGGGRIIRCLSEHTVSLSAACRKVVADAKK